MKGPVRFVERDDAKGRLLRAAQRDAPPARAHRQAAAAIVAASAASATAAGAVRGVALKWIVTAALAMGLGAAVNFPSRGVEQPTPPPAERVETPVDTETAPRGESRREPQEVEEAGARKAAATAGSDSTRDGGASTLSRRSSPQNRAEPVHHAEPLPRRQRAETETAGANERASLPQAEPRRPSLSDELVLLDRAKRCLDAQDAAGALDELDRYASSFPTGRLAPEALVLRIAVLARKGDRARARELYDQLLATSPDSPLCERARALVE